MRSLARTLLVAALLWAAWHAFAYRWTTDDAFLSYRCARNLVEGMGLVFNPGERVEVFTNPLWTLWSALGLRLGVAAESWCNVWGTLCYLGSIGLLALNARRLGVFPLAAIAAALHPDWAIFATGGLETSALTFLLIAGFVLVAWSGERPLWLACAGGIFALAAMTRHDAALVAAATGVFVLVTSRARLRGSSLFALGFTVLWVPFTAWRVWYYGDFFPNSYYAKSGALAWYSQGLRYLWLYVERYWAIFLGPLMLLAAWQLPERGEVRRQIALAASLAVVYTLYVVRVGGDFMFARFLLPATPFLLVLLEAGWARVTARHRGAGVASAVALLAAIALIPAPVRGSAFRWGVANEREYYDSRKVADLDNEAEVLGRMLGGLPVRVAFYGDEARVMYKARIALAIESMAALTEPEIARRPITARGRPGHEKFLSAEYLIGERGAHITFSRVPLRLIDLDRKIPRVEVRFTDEVWGMLLRWDPEVVRLLLERGAAVSDFLASLDRLIARLPELPDDYVERQYRKLRLFYFDQVNDPAREAAFLQRSTTIPTARAIDDSE